MLRTIAVRGVGPVKNLSARFAPRMNVLKRFTLASLTGHLGADSQVADHQCFPSRGAAAVPSLGRETQELRCDPQAPRFEPRTGRQKGKPPCAPVAPPELKEAVFVSRGPGADAPRLGTCAHSELGEWEDSPQRATCAIQRKTALTATHSPLVLASLELHFQERRDRLFWFDLEDQIVSFCEYPWAIQGDVVAWLTSPIFGLQQARSTEAEMDGK